MPDQGGAPPARTAAALSSRGRQRERGWARRRVQVAVVGLVPNPDPVQVAVVPDLPQAADLALRADLLAVLRGQQTRIAAAERASRGAAGRRMLAPVAPAADAVVLITDDKEFAAELRQAQVRRHCGGPPSASGRPGRAQLLALCCDVTEAIRMYWAWRGSWRQQSHLVTS